MKLETRIQDATTHILALRTDTADVRSNIEQDILMRVREMLPKRRVRKTRT